MAQVLSGIYIGSMVGLSEFLELKHLILPALLLVLGYTAFCFCASILLRRFCHMSQKEAMLTATSAGAGDMALNSLDMGVQSTSLVLLQIIHLIVYIQKDFLGKKDPKKECRTPHGIPLDTRT